MNEALKELLDLLDLEQIELDIFRGRSPEERIQRVFGGQVAAQALVAAGRTVPDDRYVHSLHAYFIRPGDPAIPIIYNVERVRDGRSFTTRRVVAIQHGKAIFAMSASFHVVESGVEHQAATMPEVAGPEELPLFRERMLGIVGEDSPLRELVTRPGRWTPATSPPSPGRRTAIRSCAARRPTCGSVTTPNCPTTRCCTWCSPPTPPTSPWSTPCC